MSDDAPVGAGPRDGAPHGDDVVLRGARVILRPVRREDAGALRAFLDDPAVGRWWPPPPEGEDFPFDDPGVEVQAIEVGGVVAGLIQVTEEQEPDYRHASLDVLLGTPFHGRGLGPEALALLIRHLVLDRGHHRLTIDPAVDNVRAVAAYRRVGFREVGVLRQQERDHATGGWRDGLLMDLVASDLGLAPGGGPEDRAAR